MNIIELLKFTKQQGASDLHLSAGLPPMLRLDGAIVRTKAKALTSTQILEMLQSLMNKEQQQKFATNLELDFAVEVSDVARFRVNLLNQYRGVSAVLRIIPNTVKTLKELNTPAVFENLLNYARGLILVTGPTGSGKSTTLAAMLDAINTNSSKHILTIEDPIEFVHQPKKSLITQRELGRDTKSFAAALKAALREDPDIILVGEMRDIETIALALTAAETGHLVFGTLHTTSAAKTVNRIIDVFPSSDKPMIRAMLSESIRAVVTQTLLPRIDKGRVAAHEIMLATSSIRNLIREDKVPQMYSAIQTGKASGMQTLDENLKNLLQQNIIDKKTAFDAAENKKLFS